MICIVETNEHFGISRRASNRCGYETMVVRQYDHTRHGFDYGFMLSEGVMGVYQALRFPSREAAERFLNYLRDNKPELYTERWVTPEWDPDNRYRANQQSQIAVGKGYTEFRIIPLADYDRPGMVADRKFDRTTPSKLVRWVEQCPDYFDGGREEIYPDEAVTLCNNPIGNPENILHIEHQPEEHEISDEVDELEPMGKGFFAD